MTLAIESVEDAERLIAALNDSELFKQLVEQVQAEEAERPFRKLFEFYPDAGPLRRELYPKHMAFFRAGREQQERAAIAANRVGKTTLAACEVTYHLTGRYPPWWEGRRFSGPIVAWVCGEDAKTVRETSQDIMLGPPMRPGTGTVPRGDIQHVAPRAGVPDGVDSVQVKHVSGGVSRLVFKGYDQGREAFQGAKVQCVWMDEEPPLAIYTEALLRTMDTSGADENGLMLCTFTPLLGLSAVVQLYLPGGKMPDKPQRRYVIMMTWDDAPHLSAKARASLLEGIPLYQRDARTKGVPQLGSGAIYPIPEEEITVKPFELPGWYRCAFGMDVGWNRTAAIWGALDPESDVLYLYSEHYMGQAEPALHAQAIMGRGKWVPGVIDPSARGRQHHDGQRLLESYIQLGMTKLTPADNAREAGIHEVWTRLSTGRLKVFSNLSNFLDEYRVYRRDDKGQVVKENDHLLDACFAGETLVQTDKGVFPIASLVGTEGRVRTFDGAWAAYRHCRMTGVDRPLVTLRFDDGLEVRCTPEHRFWTSKGWIAAINMLDAVCYIEVSNPQHVSRRCLAVRNEGSRADVYCLEVPKTEAFALTNGVVVHNCRYLIVSGIQRAVTRPYDTWGSTVKEIRAKHKIDYDEVYQSMWSGAA